MYEQAVLAIEVAEARADWLGVDEKIDDCLDCSSADRGICDRHDAEERAAADRMEAATCAYVTWRRAYK